jgi:membrane protease YdiL (CAAX protease family)
MAGVYTGIRGKIRAALVRCFPARSLDEEPGAPLSWPPLKETPCRAAANPLSLKEHALQAVIPQLHRANAGVGSVKQHSRALPPRLEFAIVILGAFGYFILGSVLAVAFPGPPQPISDADLQFLLIYESIVLAALLTFLRIQRWPLQRLGAWPTFRGTLVGIGLALLAYVAYVPVFWVAAAIFTDLERAGTESTLVAPGLSLATMIAVSILNPVFEELFVCGYVVSSLKERRGFWMAVNVSVAIRLTYHLYQGAFAVVGIIPIGVIFTYWYARTGRLWPIIVAHAVVDFVALASRSGW